MWFEYREYIPVAQRRANAAREIAKMKKGKPTSPVAIEGRKIANTFWGQAWCKNLESYSDFSNRLPRGRTYVCNGSVMDLQILEGKITGLVSGSELYEIEIQIDPLAKETWHEIKKRCAGQIGSLVELLQGRLSKSVMEIVTEHGKGLFPKPREIHMSCSCPDYAGMCKHIAAVMYGVGNRLDRQPDLLFRLRKVDHLELIDQAVPTPETKQAKGKSIATSDLADVFGIELAPAESLAAEVASKPKGRKKASTVTKAKVGTKTSRTKSAVRKKPR